VALAGVALAALQSGAYSLDELRRNLAQHGAPYLLALACAVSWGLYSNLSRRWPRRRLRAWCRFSCWAPAWPVRNPAGRARDAALDPAVLAEFAYVVALPISAATSRGTWPCAGAT